jgi:hypothetical protein
LNQNDIPRFATTLGQLAEIFDKPLSDSLLMAYFASLQEFPIEAVDRAARALLDTAKFFPRPAEFREILIGSAQDRASAAWEILLRAAEWGDMPSLYSYDPAVAHALECAGGWMGFVEKIGAYEAPMRANLKKDFCEGYRLATLRPALAARRYFTGRAEMSNRNNLHVMAAWAEGRPKPITMRVIVLMADAFRVLEMPFNALTMQMAPDAQAALESGGEMLRAYYLPAARPERLALPPVADDETVAAGGGPNNLADVIALIAQQRGMEGLCLR